MSKNGKQNVTGKRLPELATHLNQKQRPWTFSFITSILAKSSMVEEIVFVHDAVFEFRMYDRQRGWPGQSGIHSIIQRCHVFHDEL
ncbi:hypothetical protein NSQ61_16380 [Aeribacillus sp. FSL K6-1121]|uniref:Uncharacterized protein n=1 Tax=Geobacillus genomosp. 3 TaxID=1921421 RepID=V5LX03_GEOG3|nr:hypothetical protein M493_05862 [Geobacillus genomosp. 3]